jgi:ElaB/YqjD/DUF883 family membrane-anchored ribosome-binding protein
MEKETNSDRGEKALNDLGAAVREGEDLLKKTSGDSGEESRTLRAKLQAAIDRAKAAYERLEEKTVAAAKATDTAVREHPYHAMGLAFGVGLLIGVLASRSRRE